MPILKFDMREIDKFAESVINKKEHLLYCKENYSNNLPFQKEEVAVKKEGELSYDYKDIDFSKVDKVFHFVEDEGIHYG